MVFYSCNTSQNFDLSDPNTFIVLDVKTKPDKTVYMCFNKTLMKSALHYFELYENKVFIIRNDKKLPKKLFSILKNNKYNILYYEIKKTIRINIYQL